MQAPDPVDRADGVVYLCVTPFGAGQALAVRRQPPAIDRDTCISSTGAKSRANRHRGCPHYVNCAAVIQRRGS